MTVQLPRAEVIDRELIVGLATQFCSIPSQLENELEVAEIVYRALDVRGIELHIEEVVKGRANVVARVPGSGERAPLVLSGHLDASTSAGWSRDPFAPWQEGGRLYGSGVDDMKGAVASMIATMRGAAALDRMRGDLIFHAVMHHDTIGLGEKYVLASEGPTEGFAICGEPSDLNINTANGGALKFSVTFRGRTAHISRMEGARDALAAAVEGYRAVSALELTHQPTDRLPHLPRKLVGRLEGGFDPGKVCEVATFAGDVRTVPGMNRTTLKKEIQDAVAEVCPEGIDVDVRITAVQRAFIGPESGVLVDSLVAAHTAVRGAPPRIESVLPVQAFVTDAADLAAAGLETVVYGPGDWHFGPDRSVPVQDLVDAAQIYLGVAASL